MTVRTKELALGTAATNAVQAIYTVPAGATAIVKDFAFKVGASTSLTLQVHRGAVVAPVWSGAIQANVTVAVPGRFVVLEAGDVLELVCSSNGVTFTWHVSGSQLDGVAP